jgi:hypothetical protein
MGSSALATETLTLKTVVSVPGKITSFDISYVDTALNWYILGDRTNKGVQVINTNTNTLVMTAGQGLFTGATGNNDTSGPDGVMIVAHREIWAGDGDSTLKFLSAFNGALLGQVSTGGTARVDEMCFDPVHNIGFVANNADSPPFITAVSLRGHAILGKIVFNGTVQHGGGIGVNATDGIEQCQYNPRDGKIYVAVPEVNGAGDSHHADRGRSAHSDRRLQRAAGLGDRPGGRQLRRDVDGLQRRRRQRGGKPSDRTDR